MTATPKKLVHWNFDNASPSVEGSPFFNGTYDGSSMLSTCSLEFVNSQLVAHGFAPTPGLSLDGLSNSDSMRVVKCLLALLSQRMQDMSRAEDLSAKFKTMSYDNERARSMYRTAVEKAEAAEREATHHKSRLAAALKNLQTSENAHKQTNNELQKTRATIQGLRSTYQMEIKKKEKEVERMTERWQKVVDSQAKVSLTPLGMRCSNAAVVEGAPAFEKAEGFLEVALQQAEEARKHLAEETMGLRKIVLKCVNELHALLHKAQQALPNSQVELEPTQFEEEDLFPMNPPDHANDVINRVLAEAHYTLTALNEPKQEEKKADTRSSQEIERLQGVIASLRDELACATQQAMDRVSETRALFDKFAKEQHPVDLDAADRSMELISGPGRDEEKERLDVLRKELDLERQRFTDATIALGKDKALLEAERVKFLDEKRSWQVEMMLATLPPTPALESPKKQQSPRNSPRKSPFKSPHRSPMKPIAVGKAGSGWKAHKGAKLGTSRVVSYETEFMPIDKPSTSAKPLSSLATSLLPTSFTLPPPSPHASLPTKPALPPSISLSPPESTDRSSSSEGSSDSQPQTAATPATRRLFPVAKPFAQGMIHAYSPARPSPLRAALNQSQLSPNSSTQSNNNQGGPSSPSSGGVQQDEMTDHELFQSVPPPPVLFEQQEEMSLAAQLGVESPPESPAPPQPARRPSSRGSAPATKRGLFPAPDKAKKAATIIKDKGKAKAVEPPARPKSTLTKEKENTTTRKSSAPSTTRNSNAADKPVPPASRKPSPPVTSRPTKPSAPSSDQAKKTSTTIVSEKPGTAPGTGGARRVLVNHSQATASKPRKG